jgi:hypothetical protein
MHNSKPLKDFDADDKKLSKLYLWYIESPFCDWIHNFQYKWFHRPYHMILKVLGWYWYIFRFDYDFDGHSIFSILEYKLKRIERSLLNGSAIQEDMDMKALRIAIKLAGRLKEDRYDMLFYDRHAKKWGELKTWFTPCADRKDMSEWHSSRPNANTPEEQEQERKDFRAACNAGDAMSKREQKWFFDILNKYIRVWWD